MTQNKSGLYKEIEIYKVAKITVTKNIKTKFIMQKIQNQI